MQRAEWFLIASVLTYGCSNEGALLIEVRTDLVPGYEFVAAEIRSSDLPGAEVAATGDEPWFTGVRVAEYTMPPERSLAFEVLLVNRDGATIAERPAQVTYLGGAQAVTITIGRDCVDVICEGENPACLGGRCVDSECLSPEDACFGEQACLSDSECATDSGCGVDRCIQGICLSEPGSESCDGDAFCLPGTGCIDISCGDGEQNGSETDVDCGGDCEPCRVGRACQINEDCSDGLCSDELCLPTASCNNGLQDPDEDGVDCGGSCTFDCSDFDCSSVTDVPAEECEALRDLYDAISGPTFVTVTDWFSSNSVCEWTGLTCEEGESGQTHVVELRVVEENIAGFLPMEGWGRLPQLRTMNIRHPECCMVRGNLQGPIPPALAALTQLENLVLAGHRLTGTIPASLSTLSALRHLELSSNALTGTIPADFGELSSLVILRLDRNGRLGGSLPSELGHLASLRELDLTFNQFSGTIPSSFGELNALQQLRLEGNRIEAVPPELGDCEGLEQLNLINNRVSRPLPAELWNAPALVTVNAGSNPMGGEFPVAALASSSLEVLGLANSQMTGMLPDDIGRIGVRELSLNGNDLSGTIPDSIGDASDLEILRLQGNRLTGSVPASINGMTNLRILGLSDNQLSGPLPDVMMELSLLRTADVCPQAGGLSASTELIDWLTNLPMRSWPAGVDDC